MSISSTGVLQPLPVARMLHNSPAAEVPVEVATVPLALAGAAVDIAPGD